MYRKYRRPFEKHWLLQKIDFGVYTTAQNNVSALIEEIGKFSEAGEEENLNGT